MALLTFREIQRQVQAKIQNTNSDVSDEDDLLPKIKDWINSRYVRIYRSFPWKESVDSYDLTLTASTDEYVFDRDVTNIISIFDKTNGKVIEENTIEDNTREYAGYYEKTGNNLNDNPVRIRMIGQHTCKASVGATGEKVSVVSTNNTVDIAPNCVHVEGLVDGVEIGEDITLTGTTPAVSVNTYDATQKLKLSVGTTSGVRKTVAGKVTISGSTSSTVFAKIAPAEFAHMYHWFKTSPTPKASGTQPTWEIWYKKTLRLMDGNNDVPVFDCCLELVQGAYASALAEEGLEEESNIAEQKFIAMNSELQATRKNPYRMEQFKPVNQSLTSPQSASYTWVV